MKSTESVCSSFISNTLLLVRNHLGGNQDVAKGLLGLATPERDANHNNPLG
jgi:hypothetical protein